MPGYTGVSGSNTFPHIQGCLNNTGKARHVQMPGFWSFISVGEHILIAFRSTSCTHIGAGSKSLSFGQAVGIKIRLLSNSYDTIASAISKTIVVKSGRMEDATVVPNGFKHQSQPIFEETLGRKLTNVILISPFKPDLQIVVIQDRQVEFFEEVGAFFRV